MNRKYFSVMTYNIDRSEYNLLERLNELVKIIQEHNPDFIALQEVSKVSLEKLSKDLKLLGYRKYVPENFFITQRNHFEVIFSKFVVKKSVFQEFRTSQERRGLVCICVDGWGIGDLWILTAQYDVLSTLKKGQIDDMDYLLRKASIDSNYVVLGADTGILEYQRTIGCPEGWMDAWYEAGNDSEKFTVNHETNPFVDPPNKDRPDRIWFKNTQKLVCDETILLGQKQDVTISSHYGVLAKFKIE